MNDYELQMEFLDKEYFARTFVEQVAEVSGWIVASTVDELILYRKVSNNWVVVIKQACWQDLQSWIMEFRQ